MRDGGDRFRSRTVLSVMLFGGVIVAVAACKPARQRAGSAGGADALTRGGREVKQPSRLGRSRRTPRVPRTSKGAIGPKKAFVMDTALAKARRASFAVLGRPALLAEARRFSRTESPQAAPLSLTGSDGTGLELVALEARAAIEGPLALTELHLTFRNPQPRVIEGRFVITLPPGAAISRFAMKLAGGWQEAEVVERQAARRAYEDFLHQRQDPALLEKKAGNQFRARIFPIPASGIKEITIAYSQQMNRASDSYRLPLRGLPKIARLSVTALLGKGRTSAITSSLGGVAKSRQVINVERQNFKPDKDFVVASGTAVRGLRHQNLVVARLKPALTVKDAPIRSLLVLFDTSASRAAGFAKAVARLGLLIGALKQRHGDAFKLEVACFDQVISPVFSGKASEFSGAALDRILERRALGASNLYAALRWAAAREGFSRLLLISDGVATAGLTGGDELYRAAKVLSERYRRLDVLLSGGIRDEALAKRLVRGTVKEDGVVLDGDEASLREVVRRLSQTTLSGIRLAIDGAGWIWPSRIDGLQPDDEILVFVDLPTGALPPGQPLTLTLSGALSQKHTIKLESAARPLLERAWIKARIDRLIDQRDRLAAGDPDRRAVVRKQIIELSTSFRVLTDLTALLVLETEADYRRYGINRRALADILTVGTAGVAVIKRKAPIYAQSGQPGATIRSVLRGLAPDPGPGAGESKARKRNEGRVVGKTTGRRPRGSVEPMSLKTGVRGKPTFASPDRERIEIASAAAPRPRRLAAPATGRLAAGTRASVARRRPRALRPRRRAMRPPARRLRSRRVDDERDRGSGSQPAYSGKMASIMGLLAKGKTKDALLAALRWRVLEPGDVMALVALGETLVKSGQTILAARVFGSIIDLFPSRADMRRFAGERLEALGAVGQALAADTFAEAVKQRPDHPSSHRLLAFSLVRLGQVEAAFEALEAGLQRRYPTGRFLGVRRILREDLGLIAEAWIRRAPKRKDEIIARLGRAGGKRENRPSLRFVLNWETDANDVDFHIRDRQGGHAYFSNRTLPSGGELYADVTTGYGPECFTIAGKPKAYPYRLQIHYYSRGPMGFGMGKLAIVQHDGHGRLKFEQRPFVVMNSGAFVDLGQVRKPL